MTGLVDKTCKGCKHLGGCDRWDGFMHCRYILDKRKPRPCPAGAGCTEYEPRKRSRKKKQTSPGDSWA